jgi:hypothetical protein
MDGDGTLIDLFGPRTAGFDLPIVRGLAGFDADGRRERAQRAGALLRDLGELAQEVSEVEVEPSGDLRLVLRGEGEVLRMGAPPFRQAFLTFLGMRKELAGRCPEAEYFDLRFRSRVYVRCPEPPAAEPSPPAAPSSPDAGPAPARPASPAPLSGTLSRRRLAFPHG